MSANPISELIVLINKGENKERIKLLEDNIIESIDRFAKENEFYELPTKEILKIVGKSNIEDVELLCDIISRMNENKWKNSVLLLNEINPENATFEECVKIISAFKSSKFCRRTGKLFEEKAKLPERDYSHEIDELKKQIEEFGCTIINNASRSGNLEVVKYLYETCHAKVPFNALNFALPKGNLEIVKYLYETCHAKVPNYAMRNALPKENLELVKYLYETCHAKVTYYEINMPARKEIKEYLLFFSKR